MTRLRLPLALAALILLAAPAAPAAPATIRHDQLPLHQGSAGPNVSAVQWLLAGHRPNVFKVAPTYKRKPTGYFGIATGAAVYAMKYRLGWPSTYNSKTHPIAGRLFFAILKGRKTRPATWVRNAAARVKAIEPGVTPLALKMKQLELDWLGITENPIGSNKGPCISYSCIWPPAHGHPYPALQSSTGAYGAAWCVSTQQMATLLIGWGRFANGTASVYYAVDWAAARNLLHAKPKVGALVAFIDYDRYGHRIPGTGHMGFISKVTATGYSYISGNSNNRVDENYYALGARPAVFIYLPKIA